MNKKVLMLGPGEPSISNSGLGKASHYIAELLSKKVDLTVIQPESVKIGVSTDQVAKPVTSSHFSDFKVISEMVKIDVSGTISPYWYDAPIPTETVEVEKTYPVQNELTKFSEGIQKKAEALDFDIIYAHDWLTFQAAIFLKEKTGKPLILHVHSLEYDRNAMHTGSWVFDLEKEAFEKAEKVICVSQYSKGILKKVYGIEGSKIEVVHNGYAKKEYPVGASPFNERIVLFVGRMTGQKGPTEFLKIAELVHEQYPETRFIMAGEGDMYRSLIEAGAHSSVANRFHMTGHISEKELDKLYAMSDVYCMPSVSEPFGLTALEAAGAGLPMVISKNSGASEVLSGAVAVDFNDTNAFAEEIVNLLKNKKLSTAQVKKNQKSLANISWDKSVKKILNVMMQV